MRSASFQSRRPRSDGVIAGHGPESKARRAARTARSTSSRSPSATSREHLAGRRIERRERLAGRGGHELPVDQHRAAAGDEALDVGAKDRGGGHGTSPRVRRRADSLDSTPLIARGRCRERGRSNDWTDGRRTPMNRPPVVSPQEWHAALEKLHAKEKQATRERDALAAERRRLPRVRIDKDYAFEGPRGRTSLPDLFDGAPAAPALPLHVRPQPGGGLRRLLDVRRSDRPSRAPPRARRVLRPGLSSADRPHRGLPEAHGLDAAVVLLLRERLQPRLRRRPRDAAGGRAPGRRDRSA